MEVSSERAQISAPGYSSGGTLRTQGTSLVRLLSPGWARSLRYSSTILFGLTSLSWGDLLSNQRDNVAAGAIVTDHHGAPVRLAAAVGRVFESTSVSTPIS